MTTVSEPIGSCMSSAMTWTLLSVLITSCSLDEDAAPRRVFDAVVDGHQRVGRPRTHWKDQVEKALTSE